MGKKVKKAFKKVTKFVDKPLKGAVAQATGKGDDKGKTQNIVAPPQVQQAQAVAVAPEEVVEDLDKDTEAAKKSARAKGKQGLSVARASGNGLNV